MSNLNLSTLLPVMPQGIGGQLVQAIDGRRLHTFLEVGKDFTTWMKDRIEAYGFIEHRDFEVFPEIGEKSKGRPSNVYILSIDMAKELAMVERTAKGKEARAYFLECERRANDPVHALLSMSRPEMLEFTLGIARDKEKLRLHTQQQQATISMLEPKAEFHDKVARAAAQDALSIREFAKLMGTGQNRFFEWLRGEGLLIPYTTEPYQCFVDSGYFRVTEEAFEDKKGKDRTYLKTLITGKGQTWLQRRWAGGMA